jgi:hypothetical protein
MRLACALCLLGMCASPVFAQTPAVPSDKLAWDMKQDPAGLTFAILVDKEAPQTLSDASCGPLSDGISVCQANLPAMTPGVHTIRIVATLTAAGQAVTSSASAPLSVTFIAVVTPENVRLIKG